MFTDFIINGANSSTGFGVGGKLLDTAHGNMRFDVGLLRPYINEDGIKCADIQTGRITLNAATGKYEPEREAYSIEELRGMGIDSPVFNATTLRKEQWTLMDNVVLKAARARLKAWQDLANANTYSGFDGMAKTTLEYEAVSDPGEAQVDMDAIVDGRNDAPLFKLRSLPLPITHSDFYFSARRLAVGRNGGTPIDTTMAEAAGRRVAEMVEKTTIGVETGMEFATNSVTHDGYSKVYGYTNFPQRLTKADLTVPTGSNPEAILQDLLEMREQLQAANFFGPYMVYYTPSYDIALDNDYFRTGSTATSRTLRERILSLGQDVGGGDIAGMRRLDFWTGATYQMVMVQMTADVARAVIGMPLTTVQWESQGGMRQNWKVMTISVPQLRADFNGKTGLLHAVAP